MRSSYLKLLDRLLNVTLHSGMKLGLENCQRLNDLLGKPTEKFESIHVAGTNGKGSVCTKIAKAYELQGVPAALYTSPHIATWRERITINGIMISEEDVTRLLTKIFTLIDQHEIPATFFEISTLLAFSYFAEKKVPVAVIETGLGGRLDATNIVTPKLSIITSISLEHTEILGNTLDAIAIEKAGIIKRNVPVVIGPRVPRNIIDSISSPLHSPMHYVDGVFDDYLEENNAVAAKALSILDFSDEIAEKALQAMPLCRLEYLSKKNVVLDVAHNPDGLYKLFSAIKSRFPNRFVRCIVGLSKNKDIEGCLKIINTNAQHIHLVTATNGRGAPYEILKDLLVALGRDPSTFSVDSSVQKGVYHALSQAESKEELILICGSFFIMHEARMALGISEPADLEDLNEKLR